MTLWHMHILELHYCPYAEVKLKIFECLLSTQSGRSY